MTGRLDVEVLEPVESEGLTSQEAAERLVAFGPNRLPEPATRGLAGRVLDQLRDPMILLLLAAAVLTAVLGDLSNTAIIAVVVLFNTSVGVVQQVRAEHAMAALRAIISPTTRVLRDGAVSEVPSEYVVPGDVVALTAGAVVPADGVLTEAMQVQVNQALMTGESLPVDLDVGAAVIGGTCVTRGRGRATISRTGELSGIGGIASMLGRATPRQTPLQRRLAHLSRSLVAVISVLTVVVVASGLVQGRPLAEMLVVGLSLAVAAVPESLPAVVTIALAMGAHRMSRRNAVVKSLPAVETLGSVTVVATDKTGTITEGTMLVQHVWLPAGSYAVSGSGYGPAGSLELTDGATDKAAVPLRRLLRDLTLCNDSQLRAVGDVWSVLGDPLEGALLTLASKGGHDVDETRASWPRVAEQPFDQQTMRMTTHHLAADGERLTVCKGAPEAVLELVGDTEDARRAAEVASTLAVQGYRVIAVGDAPRGVLDDEPLHLVGLVAIGDPPREHAARVVADLGRAGIRVVLVTGDHPATAETIARRVGIPAHDVVARVRPEQKVGVVEKLLGEGEVVAMIGDGVNDAPALRRADIGVAAGRGGSEVAKQAADLVLMDDDLSTVVAAVQEGRRIFANIRAFLTYALAGGLSEVGVMLAGPIIGMALPLLAGQILWINLLTHGLTGVAFGGEPASPAEMTQPPRAPSEAIFTARSRLQLAVATVCLTVVALIVGVLVEGSDPHRRTAIFVVLGLAQLGVALALRASAPRRLKDRGLELAVLAAGALQLCAVYAPPLQDLLGTVALSFSQLVVIGCAATVPAVAVRLATGRTNAGTSQDPRP